MSLALSALIILTPSLLAGLLAYLVVSISQLKANKKMWEQAYTKLAIEFELSKAGK
jgi:uncharacterized membrane protein YjjB (DUF3815 family)